MGKGDKRASNKMKQRTNRNKLKSRVKRSTVEKKVARGKRVPK